jgi:hypothetical protein
MTRIITIKTIEKDEKEVFCNTMPWADGSRMGKRPGIVIAVSRYDIRERDNVFLLRLDGHEFAAAL